MPYQSIGGIAGDSNTAIKLAALHLSPDLVTGKHCLDIGCNEGFFTNYFLELGAASSHGIDMIDHWISAAKRRFARPTFEVADIHTWTPSRKYDIVLISSALHYMNAGIVIPKVADMLVPGGLFIYEGGIIQNSLADEWVRIQRAVDTVTHPTKAAFENLCKPLFSKIECIGPSYTQPGDPIPRFVFHCQVQHTMS